MFCQRCGALIGENAKFCTECGEPVQAVMEQPSSSIKHVNLPKKGVAPILLMILLIFMLLFTPIFPIFSILCALGILYALVTFYIRNNRRVISIIGMVLIAIILLLGVTSISLNRDDSVDHVVISATGDINITPKIGTDPTRKIDPTEKSNPTEKTEPTAKIEPTPTPGQTPKSEQKDIYLIGDIAEIDDIYVQVLSVEKTNGSEWDTPKNGCEFVVVNVAIKNGSNKVIDYNPYNFNVQNSAGQITDHEWVVFEDTHLSSGQLLPGGSVSGTLVYEQLINEQQLILKYAPSYWNEDNLSFNLLEELDTFQPLVSDIIQWEGETYGLNDPAVLDGAQITVLQVEKSNGDTWNTPKEGCEYVIVTVEIKNVGKGYLSYNPYYFTLANSLGQIVDPSIIIDMDTSLESGDLVSGGKVTGTIVFEAPINDPDIRFLYDGNPILSFLGSSPLIFVLQ